jgi:iron complex transport system substrate-binding protein
MKVRLVAYIVVVLVVIASISIIYVDLQKAKPKVESITVTDDLGRKVVIPLPVKRIVSMDPSNTQMLYGIGAGSLLVADTSYDWWPSNSTKLPKVEMDNGTASVEEVVAMNPNLVLATTIQPAQIVDQLQNLSIPVLVFEPNNISQIYSDMLTLGNVTAHRSGALKEVSSMKATIQGIESKISSYQKVSLLYMLWSSPIYTVGPGSFIDSIISYAGGINIADNLSSPYPTIGMEQVVYDNPKAIIVDNNTPITNISYFKTGSQAQLWRNISAVESGTILFFNVTESNWMNEPGPLTIYAVQTVAEFLYPQAF